jgi:hypothetical protein
MTFEYRVRRAQKDIATFIYDPAIKVFFGIFITIGISACQNTNRPEGRYSGTLYQSESGALEAKSVTFDIEYDSHSNGSIEISDIAGKPLTTVDISINQSDEITFASDQLVRTPAAQNDTNTCFSSDTAKLCYSSTGFSLEQFNADTRAETYALFGQASFGIAPPVFETPRALTLSDAMKIALQRNFSSRIEYEHAIQARLSAKSAYLQLLPHLSVGSALSVAGGGVGVFSALGDLVPFLFPSRWFQAKEASEQSQVEQDTLALMRADLMPQVEGLAYTQLQDAASLVLYQQLIVDVNTVYKQVSDLEAKGQMPAGSADHLLSSLQSLQMDEQGLEILVRKDRTSIAQALGFMNPDAVLEVDLPSELTPVEAAQSLVFGALTDAVVERSLELKQISDLTKLAKLQKKEIPFDWLDPSYDSSRDLGFALGTEVEISQSKINQLGLVSEQMQQALAATLDGAVEDYNLALVQFPEAATHFALQKKRWNTVISQVYPGTALNTLDIQSVLGDYLAAGINIESIRASFRVARARIDRLLLQNYYSVPSIQGVLP